jgi:hypothetical protein
MKASPEQERVLSAMGSGWTLKAHRYLDGRKLYQLHALDGQEESVPASAVHALAELGWIDSNKKFPAATFWLTPEGRRLAGTGR